jgi:hypothetical protein
MPSWNGKKLSTKIPKVPCKEWEKYHKAPVLMWVWKCPKCGRMYDDSSDACKCCAEEHFYDG